MTKNPLINALSAALYISIVASVIFYGPTLGLPNIETFGMPIPIIAFLSILVFSVAFMGYVFFYWPVRLLFEQKYKEAGKLFVQTILSFAVTAVVLVGVSAWVTMSLVPSV